MNIFDQFMKHGMKIEHYARYTDDFIIISHDKTYLENLIQPIDNFLKNNLRLNLHPNKIEIRKYSHGVDFLGYIILPHCKLIRKRTLKRILRKFKIKVEDFRSNKISEDSLNQSLQSYLGILLHADAHELGEYLKNQKLL